jgi:hypothetical protein
METIYRITDNTNQIYSLDFPDKDKAKKWIYTHLNMIDIIALDIRPIRKGN